MTPPFLGRIAWIVLVATLAAGVLSPAAAATIALRASLDGTQQVPPNASKGSGVASFSYDDVTRQLDFAVFVLGLEGAETASSIRGPALPGATGPAIFALPAGSQKRGTLTLTPAQAGDLLAGLWYVSVATAAFPNGEIRGQIGQALLASAVLPSSRSVLVGATATAFATIANTGPNPAVGCGIALPGGLPAALSYQTTDPGTNIATGAPNTPVDIAPGASRSFVFAITASAPIAPADVALVFDCENSPPALTIPGVNTVLLSASAAATADVIATAFLSDPFNRGVLAVDRVSRQGAFAVSALNVGASDTITVTADTGAAALPVVVSICQTRIETAGCVSPPAASVAIPMSSGTGAGLAVFVTSPGEIPLNAARNRVFIRLKDAAGVTRGSTSVAVQADTAPTVFLRAGLDGSQVVPPTSSAATGSAFFTYDDVARRMTFNLSVARLQGTGTAIEIRGPASPGANGPLIVSLPFASPAEGAVTLTAAQGADLLAGLWYVSVSSSAFPNEEIRGQIGQALITTAVLPSSRSVQVGTPATAFATIVNAGPARATACGIALATAIPATLAYQTTDPATNTVTGLPNTPVDIAAGALQTFVIALTPTVAIAPIEVALAFDCANSPPARAIGGLNTLLLSASPTPVLDVVAIALPTAGSLFLDAQGGQGAFAAAAINVGAAGTITVTADTGGVALPVTLALCQTSLVGACASPPTPSITLSMSSGTGVGLAVFATTTGPIAANAAVNRVFLRFKDAGGVTRGSTSVAIRAP